MRIRTGIFFLSLALLILPACERGKHSPIVGESTTASSGNQVEGESLLGSRLERPILPDDFRQQQEKLLAADRTAFEDHPDDPDTLIWMGRRTAYLGRYHEAIDLYSQGIALRPDEPRFYRHRGHRYITTRQLEAAVVDMEQAVALIDGRPDEVEPDGLPNDRGIPTSTNHSNIWYHLGLAHYLRGNFEKAADAYRECLQLSSSPDMLVATSHWLYMTLRRLDLEADAEVVLETVSEDLDVIENREYLLLLLMYKGLHTPRELERVARSSGALSAATMGYGVGNWYLYNGRPSAAAQVFREIVSGNQWAAFGFIAAEAELARMEYGLR